MQADTPGPDETLAAVAALTQQLHRQRAAAGVHGGALRPHSPSRSGASAQQRMQSPGRSGNSSGTSSFRQRSNLSNNTSSSSIPPAEQWRRRSSEGSEGSGSAGRSGSEEQRSSKGRSSPATSADGAAEKREAAPHVPSLPKQRDIAADIGYPPQQFGGTPRYGGTPGSCGADELTRPQSQGNMGRSAPVSRRDSQPRLSFSRKVSFSDERHRGSFTSERSSFNSGDRSRCSSFGVGSSFVASSDGGDGGEMGGTPRHPGQRSSFNKSARYGGGGGGFADDERRRKSGEFHVSPRRGSYGRGGVSDMQAAGTFTGGVAAPEGGGAAATRLSDAGEIGSGLQPVCSDNTHHLLVSASGEAVTVPRYDDATAAALVEALAARSARYGAVSSPSARQLAALTGGASLGAEAAIPEASERREQTWQSQDFGNSSASLGKKEEAEPPAAATAADAEMAARVQRAAERRAAAAAPRRGFFGRLLGGSSARYSAQVAPALTSAEEGAKDFASETASVVSDRSGVSSNSAPTPPAPAPPPRPSSWLCCMG